MSLPPLFDLIQLILSIADPVLNFAVFFELLLSFENIKVVSDQKVAVFFLLFMSWSYIIFSLAQAFMLIPSGNPFSVVNLVKFVQFVALTPFLPVIHYLKVASNKNSDSKEKTSADGSGGDKLRQLFLHNGDAQSFFGRASASLCDSKEVQSEISFLEYLGAKVRERAVDSYLLLNSQVIFSTLPQLTTQLILFSILRLPSSHFSRRLTFLHHLNLFVAVCSVSGKIFQLGLRSFSKRIFFAKMAFMAHDIFCFVYTFKTLFTPADIPSSSVVHSSPISTSSSPPPPCRHYTPPQFVTNSVAFVSSKLLPNFYAIYSPFLLRSTIGARETLSSTNPNHHDHHHSHHLPSSRSVAHQHREWEQSSISYYLNAFAINLYDDVNICLSSQFSLIWIVVKITVLFGILLSFGIFVVLIAFESRATSSANNIHNNHNFYGTAPATNNMMLAIGLLLCTYVVCSVGSAPIAILLEMLKLSMHVALLYFFRTPPSNNTSSADSFFESTSKSTTSSSLSSSVQSLSDRKMICLHHFLWNEDQNEEHVEGGATKVAAGNEIDWSATFRNVNELFSTKKQKITMFDGIKAYYETSVPMLWSEVSVGDRSRQERNKNSFAAMESRITGIVRRTVANCLVLTEKSCRRGNNNNSTSNRWQQYTHQMFPSFQSFLEKARHVVLYQRFVSLFTKVLFSVRGLSERQIPVLDDLVPRSKMSMFITNVLINKTSETGGFRLYHFLADPESSVNHLWWVFPQIQLQVEGNQKIHSSAAPQPATSWKPHDRLLSAVLVVSITLTLVVSPIVSFCYPLAHFFFGSAKSGEAGETFSSSSSVETLLFIPTFASLCLSLYFFPDFVRYALTVSLCSIYTHSFDMDVAGIVDSYRSTKDLVKNFTQDVVGRTEAEDDDDDDMTKKKRMPSRVKIPEAACERHVVPFLELHHVGLWGGDGNAS